MNESGSETIEYLEVDNTFQAATLWLLGYRTDDIRGPLGKKVFIFRDVPPEVVKAVDHDTIKVSPLEFGLAYKKLMRLLHDTQKPSTR